MPGKIAGSVVFVEGGVAVDVGIGRLDDDSVGGVYMSDKYPKIQTLKKRDPENNYKTLLSEWATPYFQMLNRMKWLFTEKIDGMNIRVVWDGIDTVSYKGRTDKAQLPPELLEHLQFMFPPELMAATFDRPVTLYGEGCGPGIQKGGGQYGYKQRFILFDVNMGGSWFDYDTVQSIADALGCTVAALHGYGTLQDAIDTARHGFQSYHGTGQAEGLIVRPSHELLTPRGDRVIGKIKTSDFA